MIKKIALIQLVINIISITIIVDSNTFNPNRIKGVLFLF
jgi:hypothetical protein